MNMKTIGRSEMAIAPTTIFVLKRAPSCFAAAFRPKPQSGARQDQSEDKKCGGDKTRNGVQRHDRAPALRFERHVQRTERKNRSEEQRQQYSADDEAPALFGIETAHGFSVTESCAAALISRRSVAAFSLTLRTNSVSSTQVMSRMCPSCARKHLYGTIASVRKQVKISTCPCFAIPDLLGRY